MEYNEWSVIYGEQPSAAKWNLLGTNDALFYQQLTEGWITAEETWTYASASTFTISGDKTTKYRPGVKVRFKQGGAYKYLVIAKSAYSAPNTTVTVFDGVDGSTYTVANSLITDNYFSLMTQPDGWPLTPDSAAFGRNNGWASALDEAWTYASATTITVPTDATTRYQKGDKIRLKQGGAYKYFYIIGVAATVLTITGGVDYTLTNATITDQYYSKVQNPIGFPAYVTLVANFTWFKMDGQEGEVWGWGYQIGNGTTAMTKAHTYGGITFATAPVPEIWSVGQLPGANPTTIGDMTSQPAWMCYDAVSSTTTGFTAGFSKARTGDDSAQSLTNTVRFGFGFRAKERLA